MTLPPSRTGTLDAPTFQPVNRVTVIRTSEVDTVRNKDLLLISTLAHVGNAAPLLERSPYRVEGTDLHVTLPGPLDDIWHIFGDTGAGRSQAMTALSTPLGDQGAAMIGAAAPAGGGRSVVAIVAGSPAGVDQMVDALRDARLVPNIQGDLALLSGGTMTSYRAGGTYHVGSLPFWLLPGWWLQDSPAWVILIIIVGAGGAGFCLYRILRWRGSVRTAQQNAA